MLLLTQTEGQLALKAARLYAESAVTRRKPVKEPEFTAIFSENRGVFVTLTENGELRGCIGFPYPVMPLGDAIKDAAHEAALNDPRFPPVSEKELAQIKVEITILTEPEPLLVGPLARPSAVVVGKHGLIAEMNGYRGLLLPQVAVEYGWNAEEFLQETCHKAGLRGDAWKNSACTILTFEGQIFEE